jgi:hypothetical protein
MGCDIPEPEPSSFAVSREPTRELPKRLGGISCSLSDERKVTEFGMMEDETG